MTAILYDSVAIARQFLFVREAQSVGQNRGLRVEAIQHWSQGQTGDSWCAQFATLVLDLCFQGDAPIPRQGSCEAIHHMGIQKGWIVDTPERGDLVLSINSAGVAHHIGICTISDPLTTIAGNTSEDGTSSNGDRVAEHIVSPDHKVYIRYPR